MSAPEFGTIRPGGEGLEHSRTGAARTHELAFRDFYADVLNQWPRSCHWWNWNASFDTIDVDTDASAEKRFGPGSKGRTGYPIVDAGMRELAGSGFMHNRVPDDRWRPSWSGSAPAVAVGRRWFLDQLVDGDMANNQHGWRWCAGSGTDAAYFRVFSPTARGEVRPGRRLCAAGCRSWPMSPTCTNSRAVGRGLSEPIVDHAAERTEALARYGPDRLEPAVDMPE